MLVAASTVLMLVSAGRRARLRLRSARGRQGGPLHARVARVGAGVPLSVAQRRREEIHQEAIPGPTRPPPRSANTGTSPRRRVAASRRRPKGPKTIDDVLEDIDSKLGLIKGVSRPEACVKMMDAISKDNSITEGDKKSLNELVDRLAGEEVGRVS